MKPITWAVLFVLFLVIVASRMCHADLLWVEEAYPSAAASQILNGKSLYRDIWFDKPPLSPLLYLLWGATTGIPLRLAGSLFVIFACMLLYRFALDVWSHEEALIAACLLGASLVFGIPSAVMALAPDLLLVIPHTAAIWLAWRGRAFWAGFVAGIGFLTNTKAVFVLAACLLWQGTGWWQMLLGFAVPNLLFLMWLLSAGALSSYVTEVWSWGLIYSKDTFLSSPLIEGASRTFHWIGFQLAAVIGTAVLFWKDKTPLGWRGAAWAGLSFVAAVTGLRFFPRYYFQLLPPFCLLGARGIAMLAPKWRVAALLLVVIPVIRFGPRYITLAGELIHHRPHEWSDLNLMQDSQRVASVLKALAKHGDTLLVWGYRPDIFVYSNLPAGTKYLDSQPLTGVFADRHLTNSKPSAAALAIPNRIGLTLTEPTFIVDALSATNPALGIKSFPELQRWIVRYKFEGATNNSVLWERLEQHDRGDLRQLRDEPPGK